MKSPDIMRDIHGGDLDRMRSEIENLEHDKLILEENIRQAMKGSSSKELVDKIGELRGEMKRYEDTVDARNAEI
jgi:chromosome segregation ATPase